MELQHTQYRNRISVIVENILIPHILVTTVVNMQQKITQICFDPGGFPVIAAISVQSIKWKQASSFTGGGKQLLPDSISLTELVDHYLRN